MSELVAKIRFFKDNIFSWGVQLSVNRVLKPDPATTVFELRLTCLRRIRHPDSNS
jgi:hypothetical protein